MTEPRKLWQHQVQMVAQAEPLNNFGFFGEPGSGKTASCIHALRNKSNAKKRLLKTLIFCPPIVIENWKNEFLQNSKIPQSSITCLVGTGRQRRRLFMDYGWGPEPLTGTPCKIPKPHIFITNYETLQMDVYDDFLAWDPEAVICDEAHRLSNYTSKRSKSMEQLVNGKLKYDRKTGQYSGEDRPLVYILTGSPILNSPMDIFQQYKILDGGKTFGGNFFGFRARYFRDKNAGMPKHNYFPDWVPIPGAMEEIGEKIKHNSMRVLKKDCMDLPPLVRKTISVEMAPEQKRLYESMLQDYVAYFTKEDKEQVTSATMGMTKGLRLMQIASGYIKTVEGKELDICDKYNPKQEALYELMQDLNKAGSKVIIWAIWKQNYVQIRKVLEDLKIKFLEINGEQGAAQNRENAKLFEADSSYGAVIANPESGGEGINLVSADHSIFYSRDYSLRKDIQAEARNYRGGSEVFTKITRIDLVSRGSLEEIILERLANKQEVGDKILREITLQLIKEKQ